MARPYPGTFGDESPLSPSTNPQTPITYSANVNRQKTKKWVEAKPVDYGGDDWGDEYDDAIEPPPPSKPTGLRQSGQAAQAAVAGPSTLGNKKTYGDLPSIPSESQPRSATMIHTRKNSFGYDDERRAFSSGPQQNATVPARTGIQVSSDHDSASSQPVQPPALHITTQNPAVTGLRKAVSQVGQVEGHALQPAGRTTRIEEPQSTTSSRYSEASKQSEVKSPVSDIQARPDFSPSAVPQPLGSRYSPAPQSATSDAPATRFPPRKSSISSNPPDLAEITRTSGRASQEVQKPWAEPRSASPSGSARSPTLEKKALPFIRPADIYRRMEEEKERERQSMDSSRPSMDSLQGPRAAEGAESPAKGNSHGLRSESPGAGHQKSLVPEADHLSESGRRPTLEPVRERKSEYGLEGFEPPPEPADMEISSTQKGYPSFQHDQAESEDDIRRFSTSPKLPDLNRMSGFGIDIFSQQKSDQPPLQMPPDSGPGILTPAAPEDNKSHLRTQPSLGFTSVVQQAFDRGIPETPASADDNGVRRTDSESTGTTGISPIMSRVPSTNLTDSRNRGADEPQNSITPVIQEVEEPQSRRSSVHDVPAHSADTQSTQQSNVSDDEILPPASFQPGHRRDISTPSPGNSPARTPNVAIAQDHRNHSGEEARISEASDPAISPVDTISQPPRPFAEREQSFRPALPGGWVSYATTASDNTVPQDNNEAQRSGIQTNPVSPISEGEDDIELTPTAAKTIFPQSGFGVAAEPRSAGYDKEKSVLSTPEQSSSARHFQSTGQSNSQLPTPDPALAPIGNPYSASAVDPRLQSPTYNHGTTLDVPQQIYNDVSSASSAPPTPPPKDTPIEEPHSQNVEYFPPTAPLKKKTYDEVTNDNEVMVSLMRPQVLPTLSTATSPQDEENDKLRKEIVKSLSPKSSDAGTRHTLAPPDPSEDMSGTGQRESTYLPSEYDSYWTSTAETESEIPEDQNIPRRLSIGSRPDVDQTLLAHTYSQGSEDVQKISSIPPPSAKRQSVEQRRPELIQNRFSWETGPEQVLTDVSPVPAALNISRPGTGQGATPDSQLRYLDQTREAYFEHGPVESTAQTPNPDTATIAKSLEANATTHTTQDNYDSISEQSSAHPSTEKDLALSANNATAGVASAGPQADGENHQRRLSLAEEKSPANASTYAVSQTPPEEDHPSRSPLALVSPISHGSGSPSHHQTRTHEFSAAAPAHHPADMAKIMPFKEILNLQNPYHRIKAFNDSRIQFVNMDTGLQDWLVSLGEEHRQMGEPSANIANTGRASNFKPAVSPVPTSPALQQPYYQQYLNASPNTSRPPTSGHSAMPSGLQQGFSSGASKLSSQQVQAKSKELLHTAGIFGGKASKAGKGLLAKGKNRFRGSGGGDKDSPSPPKASTPNKPKLKDGRRSSWAISSLTLPRSSARADTLPQHSREQTRPPHSRSSSTPLRVETPSSTNQREIALWDAPVSAASTPSLHHSVPATTSQPLDNTSLQAHTTNDPSFFDHDRNDSDVPRIENGGQDSLGVPAPIGKQQPSWDPFNATPIVEEEGFEYDERAKPHFVAVPASQLVVPETNRPVDLSSERSDSGDTAYLSAPERHSEATERPSEDHIDDWVLVSNDEGLPSFAGVTSISSAPSVPTIASDVEVDDFAPPPSRATGCPAIVSQSTAPGSNREAVIKVQEIETPSGDSPLSRGLATQETVNSQIVGQNQLSNEEPAFITDPLPQTLGQAQALDNEYASPPGPPSQQHREVEAIGSGQSSSTPIFEQSKQERYSYSAAFSPPHLTKQLESNFQLVKEGQSTPAGQFSSSTDQKSHQPQTVSGSSSQPGFIGLPPIRRSSTFGLGFGKKEKQRFPLDDDDEDNIPPIPKVPILGQGQQVQQDDQQQRTILNRYSWAEETGEKKTPVNEVLSRPSIVQQSSSNYDYSVASFDTKMSPSDSLPGTGQTKAPIRQSQEGWRPTAFPNQRPSLDAQRTRSGSASSQGYMITPGTGSIQVPRPLSQQQKLFEQPPSSAQRYPELFRPEQLGKDPISDDADLPAHHYQAPLSREEAFLPRHQTNEYQLPGVGPPPEDLLNGKNSRRNSGIFRELGGRLSRAASRDRSFNRDGDQIQDSDEHRSSGRILDSRQTHISAPSITSEDTTGEKRKRRSSFFGAFSRASTAGTPALPASRESMVAHAPGSRTDLLAEVAKQTPPLGSPEKKRSFFGGGGISRMQSDFNKPPSNKLSRSSTDLRSTPDLPGKKKRFSGLSSMFGSSKPSVEQERKRPESTSAITAAQNPDNYQQRPLNEPSSQSGQFKQSQVFHFNRDPRDLQRQGPPDGSWPPTKISDVQTTNKPPLKAESEKKLDTGPNGAPPLLQPVSLQLPVPKENQQPSQRVAQAANTPDLPYQSAQNQAQPKPTFTQEPQLFESPLQRQGGANQLSNSHDTETLRNFQREMHQSAHGFVQGFQGKQGPQSYQRQQPMVSPIDIVPRAQPNLLSEELSHAPTNREQPPSHSMRTSTDYQRQNHGGQPSLPPVQTQVPPIVQRQASSEQVSHDVPASRLDAAGRHRSSSAQRGLLLKSSPPQREQEKKFKSDSGGGRKSASRLFGGLMGRRTHSNNSERSISEPERSSGSTGLQQEFQSVQQHGPSSQLQQMPPKPRSQPLQHNYRPALQRDSNPTPQPITQEFQDPRNPQDRGRQLQREPLYEQPPIPGAYSLVRGEGAMLAPTNYDPRGMNNQYSGRPQLHDDPHLMYQYQSQQYSSQHHHSQMGLQQQGYPSTTGHLQSGPHPHFYNQLTPGASPPQFVSQHPNLSSQQRNQTPPKDQSYPKRPLSTEDLLARSPARPQFGQQAPYQLTLPEPDDDDDTEDELLRNVLVNKNIKPDVDQPDISKSTPEHNFTSAGQTNTHTISPPPELRHPLSPETYPLPQDSVFSPINPSAQEIPPPPPPKNWPPTQNSGLMSEPLQRLDRSNTINTHASEISQMSGQQGDSLNVPPKHEEHPRPESITPPSEQITPQATPDRSPEANVARQTVTTPPKEEDIYDASPRVPAHTVAERPSTAKLDTSNSTVRPDSDDAEKQLAESPDQRARRRAEQEEKILVEDGLHLGIGARPQSAEEERATMSATSYPGQEWNPYGSGVYEDWND